MKKGSAGFIDNNHESRGAGKVSSFEGRTNTCVLYNHVYCPAPMLLVVVKIAATTWYSV